MSVSSRIAWRYLYTKKSHSAVTAITAVSIIGVVIAVAAIICVLSVFNGFREVLSERLDLLTPELTIEPEHGKTISGGDSLSARLMELPEVAIAMPTVTENALAIMNDREMPITLKGVREEDYTRLTRINEMLEIPGSELDVKPRAGTGEMIWDEEMQEYYAAPGGEDEYPGAVSIGVASRLGMRSVDDQLYVFAPRRRGRVNLANPMGSFVVDSLKVTNVWDTGQAVYDKDMVVVDLGFARHLFDYTDEATRIEVKLKGGVGEDAGRRAIEGVIGPGYKIKNRMEQHELNYKMVNIEKWVTFLLLAFILVIASFNLISTMSMLILEKRDSLQTLRSVGMSVGGVSRIFIWESVYVTIIGTLGGIALGVMLCLIQSRYGLIKLAGDPEMMIIHEYPILLEVRDIFLVMVPAVLIGLVTAFISGAFSRAKLREG